MYHADFFTKIYIFSARFLRNWWQLLIFGLGTVTLITSSQFIYSLFHCSFNFCVIFRHFPFLPGCEPCSGPHGWRTPVRSSHWLVQNPGIFPSSQLAGYISGISDYLLTSFKSCFPTLSLTSLKCGPR